MLLFERFFHKDLKTEKSFEICLSNQRYNVLKFAILLFLNKMAKFKIFKTLYLLKIRGVLLGLIGVSRFSRAKQPNPRLKVPNPRPATIPDKTVETFQYNFQFRAMVPSCLKETNSPPSPPLMQCCFGLAAQACISCVTANNIAKGEGGESLLICDSKHFCQGECKKIGILVMCLNRFCPRL